MLPAYFSTIPVEGKRPLVKWEDFTSRRPSPAELAEWEKKFPAAGRAIVTGPISKLLVLDIDGPEGEQAVKDYQLPRTAEVKTPHGRHLYFQWVPELENRVTTRTSIKDKVDVRGKGGYVVFYGWNKSPVIAPIVKPPKWLIEALPFKDVGASVSGTSTPPRPSLAGTFSELKEGNRNDTFTRLAGSLRARGYEESTIFEFLAPRAREVNFHEDELKLVCQSVCRYPAGTRDVSVEASTNSLLEFMAQKETCRWIVPGLIPEKGIVLIVGLPETRKSWTLLDLAVSFASGGDWLGRFKCEQKKVLLLDQERTKGLLQERMAKITAGRLLNLSLLEGQLVPKVGTTYRMNLDVSFEAFERLLVQVKPEVILIDSLKAFQNGDITNNQNMQDVFEKIKALRQKHNVTFVILHHENKGAYERNREGREITPENIAGAAAINEVPEGIFIAVNQDKDSTFLHHAKNTHGLKSAPVLVKLVDVENGVRVEAS